MNNRLPIPKQNLELCNDYESLKKSNRALRASLAPLVNELAAFTSARIPTEKNATGSFPQDQKIHQIKWQKLPDSRYAFINSTLGIFSALQEEWKASKSSSQQSQIILNSSHKYQQELLRHVRECQGKEASLFSGIHAIWHLAHITCFERKSNIPIGPAISGWISLNFSAKLKADFESITKLAHPSQDPGFWPLIFTCVLRGYHDAAVQLLSHLANYKQRVAREGPFITNPVTAFEQLTQGKKIPKPENFSSNNAYKIAWEKWSQEASFLYDGGSLSSLKSSIADVDFPHFASLFGILAGEESAIFEKSIIWQDALIGLIQYQFPLYESRNTAELISRIKDKFAADNILDQIQISLFEQDLGLTLSLALQFDWWLVTHLVDLLEKGHFLDSTNLELLNYPGSLKVSEWFLVNFSEYLFTCPALWKASIEYLIYCPTVGAAMLETLIPQIEIDSNSKIQKLLLFCSKHNLNHARITLLRTQARKALKAKLYNQAIMHYLESNDLHYISGIVDQLLEIYINHGDKTYESVVKSLPTSCLYKSSRLAFLARYHEFQDLYAKKQYQEAANLSILLFTSGSAPKKFWRPLLLDLIPLLEGQVQVFSVDQIMELMRCAENCLLYEKSLVYKKNLERNGDDAFNVFKLAISRSLAASFVQAS